MLNTNHRTICQFQSHDCQNYALLKAALQELHSMAGLRRNEPEEVNEATTSTASVRACYTS